MQARVLIPERMDDPGLAPGEYVQALCGLRRINAWTGSASLIWKHVAAAARAGNSRRLRVLDIATGAADIPISLLRLSALQGIKLEVDACDISRQAMAFARQACAAANVAVGLFRHDILLDEIAEHYDVVICSQFLHHLSNEDVKAVLCKMRSAATRRVVAVDLERSRANWLQVWFATRILSRSKVIHFDGPQSVRAAFTVAEFAELVQQAGFSSFEVCRKWPCRFVLVADTDGTA